MRFAIKINTVRAHDLFLSRAHVGFVNAALVPVKLRINGAIITRMKRDCATCSHVELAAHAMIMGFPVEGYLDTGDRADFVGNGTIRLYPEFAARGNQLITRDGAEAGQADPAASKAVPPLTRPPSLTIVKSVPR